LTETTFKASSRRSKCRKRKEVVTETVLPLTKCFWWEVEWFEVGITNQAVWSVGQWPGLMFYLE
jgi:hypothetical protein